MGASVLEPFALKFILYVLVILKERDTFLILYFEWMILISHLNFREKGEIWLT